MGKARSFVAAQDDSAADGAGNKPPQVTNFKSSDEWRATRYRVTRKGNVPDLTPIYDWPARPPQRGDDAEDGRIQLSPNLADHQPASED